MPIVLILAFAASLGMHALALFGLHIEVSPEPEVPVLRAELKPMPKALAETPALSPRPAAPPKSPAPKKSPPPAPRSERPAASQPVLTTAATAPVVLPEPEPEVPLPDLASAPEDPPLEDVAEESVAQAMEDELSPALARFPASGEILYRVDRGDQGFEVGRARSEWEIHDNDYVLRLTTETTGLVWLFKSLRIDMESRGKLTPAGLQPEYFAVRRNQEETNEKAVFDWAQHLIQVGKKAPQPLHEGAQDLLSFNFHLGFMPQARVAKLLPITTGKKYDLYPLERVGDEMIETPVGQLQTLHLRAPGANTTELWLAYDYLLLPVRIRHEDKKGNSLVQTAIAVRLGAVVPASQAP